MRKLKLLLNFIVFSISEQIAFYRNVITKMTANPYFPSPTTLLPVATTAVDTLELYAGLARGGDRAAVANMHAAELAVQNIFRYYVSYVEQQANGNESILLSSGFDVITQPTPIQKSELIVENGSTSGTALLMARAYPKAGAYIWQEAVGTLPLNDAGWKTLTTTTRTTLKVEGLTPATLYFYRVAPVTPDGIQDFTAAVMLIMK